MAYLSWWWHGFAGLPGMEYLYPAQAAFTIWMLVDAYRRSADSYWFWVILLLPPLGPWVYFFAVKCHDFSGFRLGSLCSPRPSLDELRYRAEQTPTLASRLELAQGLMERGRHGEAIPPLEEACKQEPEHCQVLYSLAVCHAEQGHPDLALPLLEQIIRRDRSWHDYAAWRQRIATRGQSGDSAGALADARELARLAHTLQHQCLLVERLLAEDRADEARDVLEEALESYRYSPGPIRRHNRRWANQARGILRKLRVTSKT